MRTIFLFVLSCMSYAIGAKAQNPAIIPKPVSMDWQQGQFTIDKNTLLLDDGSEKPSIDFFNDYLDQVYSIRLKVVHTPSGGGPSTTNTIRLSTGSGSSPAREGRYTMKVSSSGIAITGDTHAGTFYGIQTLIQLL